jgi:hypothetical protein
MTNDALLVRSEEKSHSFRREMYDVKVEKYIMVEFSTVIV